MPEMTEEEKRKKHKEFLEMVKTLRNKGSRRGETDYKKTKDDSKKMEKTSKGKGGPAPFFKKTVG